MKKRYLFLAAIALLALLLWWLLRTQRGPSVGKVAPTADPTSQQSASVAKAPAPIMPPAAPAPRPDKLEFLRDLAQQSNRPIRFYGKVIDQDENPIPGVKVTLGVRTAKEPIAGLVGDVFDYPVVTSDAQGRFSITDAKGALLTIKSLEKPGYDASIKTVNKSYWYWRDPSQVFKPDPDSPEIFRMWRKEGAEKLLLKSVGRAIPYDGTSVSINLLSGEGASPGNDVRITLLRNPTQIIWGQRNYEWTATIEALQGGLILSQDEQMFRAPAEGYQTKLVIHVPANDPDWSDMKDLAIYLKLRDGKYYGRAELSFMVGSDREGTPFKIRSAVNPSGSRNLEYDPMQDVIRDPSARKPTPTP
jgi:hypothetical protein